MTQNRSSRGLPAAVAAELRRNPFRRWRGRHIWWMQVAELAVLAAVCGAVWYLTGRPWQVPAGRPWAVLAVLAGMIVVVLLVEVEVRAVEQHRAAAASAGQRRRATLDGYPTVGVVHRALEQHRAAAAATGSACQHRQAIPRGYVLAYEIGAAARRPGSVIADPYLTVGVVHADRWDMTDPAWQFTVRESAVPGAGVVVQMTVGGFAAVRQLPEFWQGLDTDPLADLAAVEEYLLQLGARDLTPAPRRPWRRARG